MDDIFIQAPAYPCNLSELKQIEEYLNKIDLFYEKIIKLDSELTQFSEKCYYIDGSNFRDIFSVRDYILRAFFQNSDNQNFSNEFYSKRYAEIMWEGFIYKRNSPCQICGENRSIDKCHIIPARLGGLLTTDNLLFLCPTHHRLFDRFMLSKAEWGTINWSSKSIESKKYAEEVTLEKHKMFWNKVYNNDFSKIVSDGVLYECDFNYIKELVVYIRELFYKNTFSHKKSIEQLIDPNILIIIKKIIKVLIKNNIIVSIKTEKSTRLAFIYPSKDIPDSLIHKITSDLY
ncbi:hypothetical protein GWI68_13805 [Proteus sp. G2669]|uniref:HNH endonuclease signature motif containing protein n=1 Tax=Proteus sp. G2669 TaxID=2698881 RepID=UPI0014124B21|nr:HNH endonuclease signature motif containing protein [Proteus sp. G2669]NBM55821.1 hypothetical protein [Proteus sp. G2669]